MRVLVTGGRDYKNSFAVDMALATLTFDLPDESMTLIVGDATGLDAIAEKAARSFDWNVQVYKADWDEHGRAAGPIRNRLMIKDGTPDVCLAFPGGKGTADCVNQARIAGVPVYDMSDARNVYEVLRDYREKLGGAT